MVNLPSLSDERSLSRRRSSVLAAATLAVSTACSAHMPIPAEAQRSDAGVAVAAAEPAGRNGASGLYFTVGEAF
jgi:hypothetical protein